MSTTTPAGWYPDPKPTDPANPGKRWWNGTDWTVSTKTDEVLTASTAPYAEDAFPAAARAPRKRRPVLVAASVAAVLGLAVGSLATYLIMDGRTTAPAAHSQGFASGAVAAARSVPEVPEDPRFRRFRERFGGGSNGGGSGNGSGGGSTTSSGVAVDVVDGISLPDPGTGWTGGPTSDGHAALSFGSYTCAGSGGGTCSLAGVSTSTLTASVSAGAQAAATADMAKAVSASYGTITGHTQLESKAVTVAGRSGYLIRWQVDAKVGNNGTVEDVVFPNSAGTQLIAVHFGFDITAKAPAVSVMDSILSGIQDYSGSGTSGGSGSGTPS